MKIKRGWWHCALCLRRLGYGTSRICKTLRKDRTSVLNWRAQWGKSVERPETRGFSRKAEKPKPGKPKPPATSGWRRSFDPNPIIRCGVCLYRLGLGETRIHRIIFGTQSKRRNAQKWKLRTRCKETRTWIPKVRPIKPRIRTRVEQKPKPDPRWLTLQHRTKVYLRRKVWSYFTQGLHPKSTARLLGCDRNHFRRHLAKQFQPGMTFENYAEVWELDHIVPCKLFNLANPAERQACFHYTNYQPMLVSRNRKWSARGARQLELGLAHA